MTLKELDIGEGLTYVSVNKGDPDIQYYYVSYRGEYIGIGAFSNSRDKLLAAMVKSHGKQLWVGRENLFNEDPETVRAILHLFFTYYG